MGEIFVTGHRNPDLDSTCSSIMYSRLKNTIESDDQYFPVRCGHLNDQTKYLLKLIGFKAPRLVRDLYPKVRDIVIRFDASLREEDPLINAVNIINETTVSILPVFDASGNQSGLISIDEISNFFLSQHTYSRPVYGFNVDNFEKVLPGKMLKVGDEKRFEAPVMTGAMPYKVSIDRISEIVPQKPVLIVGERYDLLSYAVAQQFPAIILTGVTNEQELALDLEPFKGTVFLSDKDTAETTRLLRLSIPVREVMGKEYPVLNENDLFDDAKRMLIGSDLRGIPVYDNSNQFIGIVSRRCFIERPKQQVIMVDHNEAEQSVPGIEHALVREIIDHHRLAAEKTSQPIYIASSPVGSTCTIVFQHYLQNDVELDAPGAKLLLAGILSDTVLLKSPTSTFQDRHAVESLALTAGVDWKIFGEEVFSRTTVITEVKPETLITTDFKIYEEFDFRFGIGQVEVVTLENIEEVRLKLMKALELVKNQNRLDWTMILITNVLKENSILISSQFELGEQRLIYPQIEKGTYRLSGILSRKKQLLPEVFRVLEELR